MPRVKLNPKQYASITQVEVRDAKNVYVSLREQRSPDGFLDLVYKFCLLGATNAQLMELLEMHPGPFNDRLKNDAGFRDAVFTGRSLADANVVRSLYKRATGYAKPSVKVFYNSLLDKVIEVPIIEHLPPDTSAAIFWLVNRQPEHWRSRQMIETVGAEVKETAPSLVINPVRTIVAVEG